MPERVLIEVCVDSVESAVAAQRGGADRIELCGSLLEGGITPSAGLTEAVRSRISLPLHVMIRPRGGDFSYSGEELDVMRRDINLVKSLNADGVVLGVLEPSARVDTRRTREFVDLARPLKVTFHRAFDMTVDLFQSLEDICTAGADGLLTSGGEQTSLDGAGRIAELVQAAGLRIAVVAGSGINPANVSAVLQRTGVHELHVGLATSESSPMLYQNPRISLGKISGREYQRSKVREEDVRALRAAIAEN